MEAPEAPDYFGDCSHEAQMQGWEGQKWTDVSLHLSPVLVSNATLALTEELRRISEGLPF